MDFKQKLKDLSLLLKEDRKIQVGAAVAVIFIAWALLAPPSRQFRMGGKQPPKKEIKTAIGNGHKEAFDDLVTSLRSETERINGEMEDTKKSIGNLDKKITEMDDRSAKIFKALINKLGEMERNKIEPADAPGSSEPGVGPVEGVDVSGVPSGEDNRLEPFGEADVQEVLPPPEPDVKKIAAIGIGDSVRVQLIAAVDAPTDGTPYPTLFKLVDSVAGPDGTALPLGEGRVVAAAQGSLTDKRVLFRLTSLSIKLPDGSRGVYPVDGWVVGEDGIRGMEGQLIDPMGKALWGYMASGMVKGAGRGIRAANTGKIVTTTGVYDVVDGNLMEYALGSGLGDAGDKWSRFIEQRSRLLVPHVRVFSGRVGTAVFSKNVAIEGLYDQLGQEESVYTSLD